MLPFILIVNFLKFKLKLSYIMSSNVNEKLIEIKFAFILVLFKLTKVPLLHPLFHQYQDANVECYIELHIRVIRYYDEAFLDA